MYGVSSYSRNYYFMLKTKEWYNKVKVPSLMKLIVKYRRLMLTKNHRNKYVTNYEAMCALGLEIRDLPGLT
jgi:hypothetical protein